MEDDTRPLPSRADANVRDQPINEWLDDYAGTPKREHPFASSFDTDSDISRQETSHRFHSSDDGYGVTTEPLIPEGEYVLRYVEHHTLKPKGSGRLVITFAIEEGDYAGTILKAYYSVQLRGDSGKFGKFLASRQGEYYEQICDLFPDLINGRPDRISPRRLLGRRVKGEVVTVTTKWNGDQRRPHTRYSKVQRLITLVE